MCLSQQLFLLTILEINFKESSAVWKNYILFVAATEKKSPEALAFQLPQCKHGLIVADTDVVYDPRGFLSAG